MRDSFGVRSGSILDPKAAAAKKKCNPGEVEGWGGSPPLPLADFEFSRTSILGPVIEHGDKLLDKRPLILQEGDVLIFGSQRHSVPKMSNCLGERISLSLFW